MLQKRNIAVWIILSIVTCGIAGLVWMAAVTKDVALLKKDVNYRNGATVVLLAIVTCGIYALYWYYVTSQDIAGVDKDKKDNSIINVLLAFFGLAIVSMALMQNQINTVIDAQTSAKQ
jgi:O-antigen/teichoic acid export membrane protein